MNNKALVNNQKVVSTYMENAKRDISNSTKVKNKLIEAADIIFILIIQIRYAIEQKNIIQLQTLMIDEIKNFEKKLVLVDYPEIMIIAARYCLCTAIDEVVLSTAWGKKSIWTQEGLLSYFQKETWGGERFYIILENMLKNIRDHIEFIEFGYCLMSLGFEGKLYGHENKMIRNEIRHRIFYHIKQVRNCQSQKLSPQWKVFHKPHKETCHKIKLKKITIITLTLFLISLGYYNFRAINSTQPILNALSTIANVSPVTIYLQVSDFNKLVNSNKQERYK